ncbi:uncharacterized protein RHIMIDRAFT_265349 [Rhizopus microsporus ATCC 52813]|uniref:Uncharacterized protein n=1 Tax=Rhizopus microsporus ATCC 52813 TaxID=1340429 RepID=A0A2G4T546_RHIZD|nr:uncharacterized protein RHIMIDRAFT_265349 [Rhizopus microsporus ATCC 52813]PHZ16144.1 hypothetical protein RHIMIDRAFT_265349 [Rhizopus microsporus ATCC 52813]
MTIQVRSKRRILPKRSVIDIDFVSSKSNNLQDLLCTSTQIPSKKDYSVINELFGDQSKFPSQREHLPHIVLGTPKRSRLLQKQEDRENLVESQKIHENIPVKSNDQENQDEKHVVGQGVLEKTKGLSNGKRNVLSENVIKTSTSTSSVSSSTSTSSDSSNISTSSGSSSNSDSNTNSGSNVSYSSSGISEHNESVEDTISSNNHNNNRVDNDHKEYELIDDLSTSSSTIDTSTSTSTVNTNTSDIISIAETICNDAASETLYNKQEEMKKRDSISEEPVVVIELTKRKKKLKVKELNPCERKESFMFPPKKEPKIKARHELLKTLKGSGALDWIINGRDRDSRKEDIGKVRKRQLERRLQRPFVTRKLIHNKNGWLIKQ